MITTFDFEYVNHRGDLHSYKTIPIGVEFGPCNCFPGDLNRSAWILKCLVLERSGEKRNVIRSFAIIKLLKAEEKQIETG
jgi:hypothetical protein